MDIYCKCGSILPLSPGETCQICGQTIELPMAHKEMEEFYYQSKVDVDDKGIGIWKHAVDEGHCLQMHRLDYNVRKIIRRIPVAVRHGADGTDYMFA